MVPEFTIRPLQAPSAISPTRDPERPLPLLRLRKTHTDRELVRIVYGAMTHDTAAVEYLRSLDLTIGNVCDLLRAGRSS